MSLRERKKRLTQATIEETALRLFQQRGYEQTSIQDIADAVMMSPRTFFRYFASKEDLLFAPTQAVQNDGIRYLQQVPSTESPLSALTAVFVHMASLYQQQRAGFLICYQVAVVTPSLAPMYLHSLAATEPAICDALCAHLETVTNRNDIRFLVAICMAAFRVALEVWLEQGATGDLIALFRENLGRFASLSQSDQE